MLAGDERYPGHTVAEDHLQRATARRDLLRPGVGIAGQGEPLAAAVDGPCLLKAATLVVDLEPKLARPGADELLWRSRGAIETERAAPVLPIVQHPFAPAFEFRRHRDVRLCMQGARGQRDGESEPSFEHCPPPQRFCKPFIGQPRASRNTVSLTYRSTGVRVPADGTNRARQRRNGRTIRAFASVRSHP